jgi:hypothetical protein
VVTVIKKYTLTCLAKYIHGFISGQKFIVFELSLDVREDVRDRIHAGRQTRYTFTQTHNILISGTWQNLMASARVFIEETCLP